ncbi:hypothetical protein EUX98_g944 [Antrodiella citrinella]|uniref:P-loop containing nucleoside triphosphate hydrolase protein n=1 Tax=Antrodiella citrinella TaxID=2447956 RepID=A0A4S4N2T4_9APHY|nr:hypothetical protein EUX98_g944 [Antrodiella citrinella]
MAFHIYCDPIVYKANKVQHIKRDELPALSDSNFTKNLVNRSYPSLDPLLKGQKRHLWQSLILDVFLYEHLEMGLMIVLKTLTSFLGPLGVNRLLNHLETGGEGAIVKPWVWMIWLLLGPMLGAVFIGWYQYIETRTLNQAQAILTQLIFDHALRMRVKADVAKVSNFETRPSTPDGAVSLAESTTSAGQASADGASTTTSATKTSQNLVGKLNNLVTTDLAVFYIPVQIIVSMFVLYAMLGWSILPGLVAMAIMIPIPGYLAKLLRGTQVEKMAQSDDRVQSVTETMNMIRMVKLFGWEPKVSAQLAEKRKEELKSVRKLKLLSAFNAIANNVIPLVTIVLTYGTYTVIMKQTLTASKVFPSMAIFGLVQSFFASGFYLVPNVITGKVSLDRITGFLNETELLDEFTQNAKTPSTNESAIEEGAIGIRAASFTWTADSDGAATPGSTRRNFTLRIEDEVFFKRACINLVIGQTGCGKTSLLMALLGEMHWTPTGPDSFVSLPRGSGVAYHAQESWVLNDTIRENILFGSPYDEERYNAVVEQCALKHDLALFDTGDQTEVGEKGLTLSGGQKARITLARAVYSSASILLLDDVLAALDVHTAKAIVEKCFRGELLHGRTVILVTHNIALTAPVADFVVSLSSDGRIISQGSLSSALAKDKTLQLEVNKEQQALEMEEQTVEETTAEASAKPKGQLIVEEEVAIGRLSWSAFRMYLGNMSDGKLALPFWIAFIVFILINNVFNQLDKWVLGLWTREYNYHNPSEVSALYYVTLYSCLCLSAFVSYGSAYSIWSFGSVRASQRIHGLLIDSVLGATLRWLDKTPISRVITRCTQDIALIDGPLSNSFYDVIDIVLEIAVKFGAVIIISPIFSVPGIIVILVGVGFGHIYMRAELPVKRESSNAKSPVLGHFGSAVSGLVSIRAYGAQAAFRKGSYKYLDNYTRAQITAHNLSRWVNVRCSSLGGIFSSALAAYLIYGRPDVDSSTIGFSLTMAVGFADLIMWAVRMLNTAETQGTSIERVQQYLEIEAEPKATTEGEPPAYWPASGELRVEGLSARYSVDGSKVLHDLSFHIKSGERVGIVGRTGSGKSSLTLALLRCILTEGDMFYDGLKTDTINLSALRSHITIIPQVPELLSGTLRQNLDPFSQHDDAELNDALRAAGLFSLQSEDNEHRITLDAAISGGGSNLSIGQRQILALARAIVRRSKLLILDEATSAIDYETDNVIQTFLRSKLDKDVTLLTVAHRLQTIMDSDRIMVLDAGRIAEFDKPSELLKNQKGLLRLLVDESGDKDKLYAMVTG